MSRRPSAVIMCGFICVALIMAIIAQRFLTQLIAIILLPLAIIVISRPKSKGGRIVFYTAAFLSFISLVSPIDVAIRRSDGFALRWVRIIVSHGRGTLVTEAKEQGMVEDADYVVYKRFPSPPGPWRAILITIPSNCKIETPFFNSF
jgi:hypothetical protein